MKKRVFLLLLAVLVVSLFSMVLLSACNPQQSEVYYLSKGSAFTVYPTEEDVPQGSRLTKGENGVYTYTADFASGDQFVIYNVGSESSAIASLFSSEQHLTLASGKVTVADAGNYALSLNTVNGELSYVYTAPQATVSSVAITDKVTTLTAGTTHKFVATVTMSDATTNGNVTWSSSEQQYATVDADGTVHAVAPGTTTITATAGGQSDSVELTIVEATVPVTSITLSGNEVEDGELYMFLGDEAVTVTIAVLPAEAGNKAYTFELQGTDGVVSVTALQDGTGYTIAALKVGETKLIVKSVSDPAVTAELSIYVDPVAVSDLQASPASIGGGDAEFYVDDEQNVTVNVLPANATDKTYTYELSQDNIVQVSVIEGGYQVKALAVGQVNLTIKSSANDAATAVVSITVSPKVVKEIEMETEITVEIGSSHQLTPVLKPEGVVDDGLLWEVKPSGIVEVDKGKVTALAAGEATVTVQSSNGVTASCKVIVPKHLTEMSIPSALTVYTGEGAKARDITVTYSPSDATYKDFDVKLEQTEEFVSVVKGEGKVTVTGLKAGTATLTLTSTDTKAEGVSATCTITVKDISEAVPYVSKDEVTVDMEGSEVIQVLSDNGEITNVTITNSYTSMFTAAAKKGDDGVWNVTITGKAFSHGTITVKATVAGSVTSITVQVTVAADYFYLTGDWDADGSGWEAKNTEAEALEENVLMTKTSATTWEITREFATNAKFYVLPSNIDTNWTKGLRSASHYSSSNSTCVSAPDADNAQVKYKGNYTVKLTLSTSGAKWTVTVNYLDVTSASLKSDAPSIVKGAEDQDVLISLTVQPTYAQSYITSQGTVTYEVEAQYRDWFTVTPNEGNKFSCTFALIKFEGEEEVKVKITAAISIGEYTATAEYTLTLMPEGAKETPVTEVTFDNEGPVYVNVSGGWTYTVHATVNEDATVQGVRYSLVSPANTTKYNDTSTMAFTIDAASGKITAKQFGKITVRATSEGKNAEGTAVTKDVEILFYSDNLMITGSYYKHDSDDWNSNTLKYTSKSDYVYTWTNVELHTGNKLVFVYSTTDWSNGVMRTQQYHGTDSPSGYGATTSTDSSNGGFVIKKDGIYTITLDLKNASPKISFTKTADIEVAETWSYKVSIYLNYVNTWTEGIASVLNQTVTQDNPTVKLAYNFSNTAIKAPSSSAAAKFNWAYSVDSGGKNYLNNESNTIKYTGACSTSWTSSTKWYNWKSGSQGNDELQYVSSAGLLNQYWTFTFTFDATGKPTTCNIASGNTAAAAANLEQAQSAVVGLNSASAILADAKRQVAVLNSAPAYKF